MAARLLPRPQPQTDNNKQRAKARRPVRKCDMIDNSSRRTGGLIGGDGLTIIHPTQILPGGERHGVGDEFDVAVAEDGIDAARVLASGTGIIVSPKQDTTVISYAGKVQLR